LIIIVFILYGILLLWLFDFFELKYNKDIEKKLNTSICIIINQVHNINDLIRTLDSIQYPNSNQNLELILIDISSDDMELIMQPYNNIFKSINIVRSENYDFDKSIIDSNNILVLQNGIELANNFIDTLIQHLDYSNMEIMIFSKINCTINKKNIFTQIYASFKQSIKSSLINKNIYNKIDFNNECFLVGRDFFIENIDNDINLNKANFKYIIQPNLYINTNKIDPWPTIFLAFYFPINLIYLFCIILFISNPDLILLISIVSKVFFELYLTYSYYNKLEIKFPKIEFCIYSIIIPFYILSEVLLIKRTLNK